MADIILPNSTIGVFGSGQLGRMFAIEARKMGYEWCEFSWILEDNMPMRRISEMTGGARYKTYRIYEKALA